MKKLLVKDPRARLTAAQAVYVSNWFLIMRRLLIMLFSFLKSIITELISFEVLFSIHFKDRFDVLKLFFTEK